MFRKLWEREAAPVPWRDLAKIFRTWEARGEIRGGRFVDGVWGEQFALPEAVTRLRAVRREQPDGRLVSVGVHDPLNLHGLLTPGEKMAPVLGNRILYRDGVAIAVAESGQTTMLAPVDGGDEWTVKQALIRRLVPPKLRAYLGKGIG
jgi:ATP-dependent Lhr-like helicase